MKVRLARLSDAEAIRAIYNLEVTTTTVTFDLVPRTLEEQKAWQSARSGAHVVLVAEDPEGQVIGFGSLSAWRDRPAYSTTVEDSVYVRRDHRGRGVGRALLTELVATATAHGFHACMARIVGGHEGSIVLHRSCGFEIVGTEREVGRKFGRWLDVVLMERLLGVPDIPKPCGPASAPDPSGSLPRVAEQTAGPDGAAATFPRSNARTQRFTLGAPRDLTVSPDGQRVAFLRSGGPEDPVTSLWVLEVATGVERVVADPRALLDAHEAGPDAPLEELARRERARESAEGIVAYAADASLGVALAALGGRLVAADLRAGSAKLVETPGPVFDPRPSPDGSHAAWVQGPALWVAPLESPGAARELVGPLDSDGGEVRWGSAEFVAAEEMGRQRGHWWAPDGSGLLAARVDLRPVARWWIADPADPARAPASRAYPAAGGANADVSLWWCPVAGDRVEIRWDRAGFPYLAQVAWRPGGAPLILVQSRDQRRVEVREADLASGRTDLVWADEDDAWVELVASAPDRLADGRFVTCADRGGVRRLLVAGEPVTPDGLQVRGIVAAGDGEVLFTGGRPTDATSIHVLRWRSGASGPSGALGPSGPSGAAGGAIEWLTVQDGVHSAVAGGGTVVVSSASLDHDGTVVEVRPALGQARVIRSLAATPPCRPNPRIGHLGERRIATALLLPQGVGRHQRLPVLVDAYGGPHAQRVLRSRAAFASSQWFAEQGFAVVLADGRGTPGRGSEWERAVHRDLASPVLEDQIEALYALAAREPRLDLGRVAIRGWSFGGYLAALAVLRRPEVFHAAVAGAPVTEWRLYDTHYAERYLGDPTADPAPYDATSLLPDAHSLRRPLLLIHGLADDNVVAAHTLRLSAALLAAGRAHTVLPLPGVTHLASQEEVAENLLLLQLDFLRRALG